MYVDRIAPEDSGLKGVMISDRRNPREQSTIIARNGVVFPNEREQTITLRLMNGSIFGIEAEKNATHVTSFAVYDLTIRPGEELGAVPHDPQEMSSPELKGIIAKGRLEGARDYIAETELARRYAVPVASMLFAILGVTLGIKPARGGQSERFGLSLALFFAYYTLMRAGQTFAERGKINALLAMSIPDIVFAAMAAFLFYRAATDRGDQGRGPGDLLWDLIERFERRKSAV